MIKGLRIARHATPVSHLFFADDTPIFFQFDLVACEVMKLILLQYCSDSRQFFNFQKSSIIVSPNFSIEWVGYLEDLFNNTSSKHFGEYLGS